MPGMTLESLKKHKSVSTFECVSVKKCLLKFNQMLLLRRSKVNVLLNIFSWSHYLFAWVSVCQVLHFIWPDWPRKIQKWHGTQRKIKNRGKNINKKLTKYDFNFVSYIFETLFFSLYIVYIVSTITLTDECKYWSYLNVSIGILYFTLNDVTKSNQFVLFYDHNVCSFSNIVPVFIWLSENTMIGLKL